jgi:hypothetical protein
MSPNQTPATDLAAHTPAVLLARMTVRPENAERYNAWYLTEHVAERLALPGFRCFRRYERLDSGNEECEFLTVYDVDSLGALRSTEYLDRLDNPTVLTTEMAASSGLIMRTACRNEVSAGCGIGGFLAVQQVTAAKPWGAGTFPSATAREVLEKVLSSSPYLVAARVLAVDEATSAARDQTREGLVSRPARAGENNMTVLTLEAMSDEAGIDGIAELRRGLSAVAGDLSAFEPPVCFRLLGVLSKPLN